MLDGDVAGLTRRPVDAGPVLAQAEGSHVDHIENRRYLEHVHALAAAGQDVVGDVGQVPALVRPAGQNGHLPHQLPFELGLGPGGVLPLTSEDV